MNMNARACKIIFFLFFAQNGWANIVGTDIQNFNPTTSGLDFVTVQSSETLSPGIANFGVYLNYSRNTLAYTRSVNNQVTGRKPGDNILGMDLNLGLGLTDNWDFGVSLPAVLSQELSETTGVARYGSRGLTEIRVNTKYRFFGDSSQGLAAVISINHSVISNNPFAGKDAGPTINYELVADTTIAQKFGVALNLGFRQRSPGTAIVEFPYEPLDNQWLFSAAGNYLVKSIDTKFIAEIFASEPVKKVTYADSRSQTIVESLIGAKHDYSSSLALHAGFGTQLQRSVASPEWRVYVGLNYTMGPFWKKKEPIVENIPTVQPRVAKQMRVRGEVMFEFNSAEIRAEAFEPLRQIAEDLLQKGFQHLTIEGHTDSVGNDEYNRQLSQQRADSVKLYLVNNFKIESAKITAIGKGEAEPIADNGNYQGRRENRRVEFEIERFL